MLALLWAFERGRKDDEYTNVTAKKDKKKTTRSMRTGKQNKKYDKEKEKREGGMQCWMDGWMDGCLLPSCCYIQHREQQCRVQVGGSQFNAPSQGRRRHRRRRRQVDTI